MRPFFVIVLCVVLALALVGADKGNDKDKDDNRHDTDKDDKGSERCTRYTKDVRSLSFVNYIQLSGTATDKFPLLPGEQPGALTNRLGGFSDLVYSWKEKVFYTLPDRGPGGGVYSYKTRVQKIKLDIDRKTGVHYGL